MATELGPVFLRTKFTREISSERLKVLYDRKNETDILKIKEKEKKKAEN